MALTRQQLLWFAAAAADDGPRIVSAGGPVTIDPVTVTGRQLILVSPAHGGTFTDAGGGKLSQWDDVAGSARHGQQATAGERPDILSSPTRFSYDGLAFELDGTGSAGSIILAAAYTCFAVFDDTAGSSTNQASTFNNDGILIDTGSLWGLHFKTNAGVTTAMAYNWDGADKHADIVIPTGGGKKLVTWWRDSVAGSLNIQLNGGTPVTVAGVGAISGSLASIWYVGGRGPASTSIQFAGVINDIASFNVTLSDSDRNGINAFYKARHGIP